MSGFTTHREVHVAPAGYCIRARVVLTDDLLIDIRSANLATDIGACPWLDDGQPGHHTEAQRQSSAILKQISLFAPDLDTDRNYYFAESQADWLAGRFIADQRGRLDITWPVGARKTTAFIHEFAGELDPLYIQIWFDIPEDPA